MTVSRAGNMSLVGGALALDFANTASARDTADPVERLQTAAHLLDWAVHVGSIDATTASQAYAAIASDQEVARSLLHHGRELRDAVYGIGSAIARRQAPRPADLDVLKDCARKTLKPAALKLVPGNRYGFDFAAAPAEDALLGTVAWSAIDLIRAGNVERIKQCPGHDCGWLFLDISKNNSRRWCDMAVCGNRAKARTHRERSDA